MAQRCELAIGESEPLHAAHRLGIDVWQRAVPRFGIEQFLHLVEEPGIDPGHIVQLVRLHAELHRALHLEDAFGGGTAQGTAQLFPRAFGEAVVLQTLADGPAGTSRFECPERLLEGFLERATDGHGLAD